MGGMVAQALAVLHPGQVSKLVLAATQPGTGKGLPIPAAAASKAASASPRAVLSVLFPPAAVAAARAYVVGILGYPHFYVPPRATVVAQGLAIEQWIEGKDAVGLELAAIKAPTLVADGTVDDLDPVANDRLIAASIKGAKLDLYPGAGHAFLFQDEANFVPAVEHFLA
jgi:pimeloyl-ACP methyl ester carboxylesterase